MEYKVFISQFIKNPNFTGAILPSSKKLCKKMMEGIDFNKAECIVEYGPGTGVFTEELIKRRKKDTILIAIEYNEEFYDILVNKFSGVDNLFIINDSAENIKEYLKVLEINKVDYIVSGLPFTSLPSEVAENILRNTKEILSIHGVFITFQYTLLKLKLFRRYFNLITLKRTFLNVPPAYVLICNNGKEG
ncbi:class I SAM-dependent methyltransferase [Thermobrachium celere]|uniref:Ribosomal RNA adenine dimethylase n=1 Tax=Thermobrachium celere DSM 8682 TaxID=941824 RepID=R7RT53_9CLOT|nr:rRNA adenine N-6-methyltransferase family protein [Thermobrachium celere]CDF58541.1 ribosomal RNA adenine dimethylase [Thermobrachium celere DSM 8682]